MVVRGAGPGESAIFTVPPRKTESRIVSGLPDLIRTSSEKSGQTSSSSRFESSSLKYAPSRISLILVFSPLALTPH